MFQGYSTVADHYLYLPMLGVAMGAAWVINRWPTREVGVAAGVVIVLLGAKSIAEQGVWADDVSLFRHAVAVNPGSSEMRVNLASALQLQSEREGSRELQDEAVAQLREALRIKPESVTASENLAVLMIQRGRIDEAIRLLLNAIAVADRVPPEEREKLGPSHRVLGAVLEKRGRLAEAEAQYRAALEYEPGSKEIEGDLERVRKREAAAASRPATTRGGGK
jgi:tetratricopeptide (TPR) repeat protein